MTSDQAFNLRDNPRQYGSSPNHVVRLNWLSYDLHIDVCDWITKNCKNPVWFGQRAGINPLKVRDEYGFDVRDEYEFVLFSGRWSTSSPLVIEFEKKEECALFVVFFPELVRWTKASDE